MKILTKLKALLRPYAAKIYRKEYKIMPLNYHQEWHLVIETYWFSSYADTDTHYKRNWYFSDYHQAAQSFLQKQKTATYFEYFPGWEDIRQGEVNHLLGLV